jgi:signal transduction histidine kinase
MLVWPACVLAWEFLARPALDKLASAGARSSSESGFRVLALINLAGASLYAFFPISAWMSGTPLGMVLATAWISGSASHLPVYFASHRLLMAATVGPLLLAALIAPFSVGGSVTPFAVLAAIILVFLIAGSVVFGHDRKVMLRALSDQIAARTQAERANMAKSRFLVTMGAELRAPLNAIVGYAELIEEEAAGPTAEDARRIRLSAQQVVRLLNVILDVSRLETGVAALHRERLNVAVVLHSLQEAAAPLAEANGASLNSIEATALGEAELDHVRLHQCLMQLVTNAIRAAPGGEITVSASRLTEDGHDILRFDVADSGPGLSEEQIARIFEPFSDMAANPLTIRDDAVVSLAFARDVARLMGGDISCKSAPNQGSTYSLWIDAGGARSRSSVAAAAERTLS